jgi:hypothetical protein
VTSKLYLAGVSSAEEFNADPAVRFFRTDKQGEAESVAGLGRAGPLYYFQKTGPALLGWARRGLGSRSGWAEL